jgi:hypothetical protein
MKRYIIVTQTPLGRTEIRFNERDLTNGLEEKIRMGGGVWYIRISEDHEED